MVARCREDLRSSPTAGRSGQTERCVLFSSTTSPSKVPLSKRGNDNAYGVAFVGRVLGCHAVGVRRPGAVGLPGQRHRRDHSLVMRERGSGAGIGRSVLCPPWQVSPHHQRDTGGTAITSASIACGARTSRASSFRRCGHERWRRASRTRPGRVRRCAFAIDGLRSARFRADRHLDLHAEIVLRCALKAAGDRHRL